MVVMIDLGQIVEVAVAQLGHRAEEAAIPCLRTKTREAFGQGLAIPRHDRPDRDLRAILEGRCHPARS